MYQALCLSQTQAPGLHSLTVAIYLIISVSCIQVFSQTLYEHLRQDSFRQAKITKGINKLSAAQQTCIQLQPQIPGGKEVQTKSFCM